jgi:RNA polymerase primary sigma factor
LTLYYREIGSIPLLTREEELALAARVRAGDEAAREQMIKANLRLVVTIARGFENCGVPLLDLINEGNIGLMKAIERFEPERGAKLSVYASFWIKQRIRRAIGNQARTVRLPIHMQEKLSGLARLAFRLHDELGREPTEEEIAEESGLPVARVRRWRAALRATLSLDAPTDGDQAGPMAEIIADERARKPDEVLGHAVEAQLLAE